jgi:hypothetical protein
MSITEWVKVFDERKDRLKRCIDAKGEHLENDKGDAHLFFPTTENLSGAKTDGTPCTKPTIGMKRVDNPS